MKVINTVRTKQYIVGSEYRKCTNGVTRGASVSFRTLLVQKEEIWGIFSKLVEVYVSWIRERESISVTR